MQKHYNISFLINSDLLKMKQIQFLATLSLCCIANVAEGSKFSSKGQMTWHQCSTECNEAKLMMPCINNKEENDQLYNFIKNLTEDHHSHSGWLDYYLNKSSATAKFRWGNNCESTFEWFNKNEPNHGNGVEEHAALMTSDWSRGPHGNSTGGWNDEWGGHDCKATCICQQKPTPQPTSQPTGEPI